MKVSALMIPLILFLLAGPGAARAIPNVWGVWTWDHPEPVQVLAVPGGGGLPLTSAASFGGAPVNATVRIQLWYQDDSMEDPQPPEPVAGFPAEDLWLEAPGLMACPGGTTADADTDTEGWFTFSLPLSLGGWTDPQGAEPYPMVLVSGSPLYELNGPIIRPTLLINSPDINADGQVNLTDLGLFATDYTGEYSFRSDFFWDGVLNLTDVGRLAAAFGNQCP